MDVPGELRYTADHVWVRLEGARARLGITDFAQDALGDVVFVELPSVGTIVAARDTLGEVESTKSVSEIYAPVSGRVAEVNVALGESPEKLNEDPYGEGWICLIEDLDPAGATELLGASQYEKLTLS